MLKVALVGVGGISGAHIPAWDAMEETELCAICDIRPEQMEKYPDKRHYTDLTAMLDAEKPDILDICLPTYLHADTAVMAMERGIHVLTEKPVSLKKADVARVYATAAAHHVCFMVAQVLRFWPSYVYLKEIYDKGTYGRLLSGNMSRLGNIPGWSWDGWMRDERRSGLVPFDLHIHDLDFMVYAFGKPQETVVMRSKRPEQDYLSVQYRYGDFFINTEAAWYAGHFPFCAGFRFQFEKALIVNEGGTLTVYLPEGEPLHPLAAEGSGSGALHLPTTNAYANEIRYFTDCVLAGKPAERVKADELETVLDILGKL